MEKKHFVFDMDDTLTNSYEFNQQMFWETFLPHAPLIDETFVRDLHFRNRGRPMLVQFEEVIKTFNLKLDPKKLTEENEKLHIKNVHRIKAFQGMKETLSLLKSEGKVLSICTNRQYGSLEKIIKGNKMEGHFENIISCLDEGHEKPDPTCLINLVNKYKDPADSFIYIGDSDTDKEFAVRAGMDFFIVDQYSDRNQALTVISRDFSGYLADSVS